MLLVLKDFGSCDADEVNEPSPEVSVAHLSHWF